MTCCNLLSLRALRERRQSGSGNCAPRLHNHDANGVLRRACLLVGVLALVASFASSLAPNALGQGNVKKFTVTAKSGAGFAYWSVSESGKSTELKPFPPLSGETVSLEAPRGSTLHIVNLSNGTLARFSADSGLGDMTLAEDNFKWAQTLPVVVKANGQPVTGVVVTLQSKEGIQQAVVGEEGKAYFHEVPLNQDLLITLSNSSGSTKPVKRTASATSDSVALTEDVNAEKLPNVKTVASTGAGKIKTPPDDTQGKKDEDKKSGDSRLTNLLVSLVVVVVLAFGLFWLVDTGRMNGLLGKIGLNVGGGTSGQSTIFTQQDKKRTDKVDDRGTLPPIPPPPSGSGPRLVATLGSYAGSIFPLLDSNTYIGREPSNNVPLSQDTAASRRHAHIQFSGGQHILVDDGSSNGTYVNGVRVQSQQPHPLRPGDELQIGNTRFRFEA